MCNCTEGQCCTGCIDLTSLVGPVISSSTLWNGPTGTTTVSADPVFAEEPDQCYICNNWYRRGNRSCCVYHGAGTCCHVYDLLVEAPPKSWFQKLIPASWRSNSS